MADDNDKSLNCEVMDCLNKTRLFFFLVMGTGCLKYVRICAFPKENIFPAAKLHNSKVALMLLFF